MAFDPCAGRIGSFMPASGAGYQCARAYDCGSERSDACADRNDNARTDRDADTSTDRDADARNA